jgi:mRNA (2'-O-methyladenosine-N6-)-methyltransferase
MRSPFSVTESKSMATQFADCAAPETVYTSEEKPMALDAVMAG